MLNKVLSDAKKRGIQFFLSEGKLKVRAEKGAMTDELRNRIKTHKAEIIEMLESLTNVTSRRNETLIEPAEPGKTKFPLSYAQQRLWFIDQLEETTPQYNMPTALKFTGRLNEKAMQKSLNALMERHAVLRTVYIKEDDRPFQVINEPSEVNVTRIDLSHLKGEELEQNVKYLSKQEANTPFDLSSDPMLRVTLLSLAPDQCVLLITIHHIACDGWGIALLTQDFVALYQAFDSGSANTLEPLSIQYADYAQWQRNTITEDKIEEQFRYWQEYLSGAPETHALPLDYSRPKHQDFNGQMFRQTFSPMMLNELKLHAKKYEVTLFILLRSVFALLVGRWGRSNDVVIAGPIAGRTETQLQPLLGCFINTLIYRNKLIEGTTFEEYLLEDKLSTLNAYDNQDIPFDIIVERLKPQRTLSYSPLFQIVFTLQNNDYVALNMADLDIEGLEVGENIIKFDLQLTVFEADGGLQLDWGYSQSLFEHSTIERLAKSYEVLLLDALKNPALDIFKLKILPEKNSETLPDVNSISVEQSEKSIPIVPYCFEKQVVENGRKVAVKLAGNSYTYDELNDKALSIAKEIRNNNVRAGDIVALCFKPSFEMIAAIFAVWKVGAAYVPLEPDYPEIRKNYILKDSQAKLLLTCSDLNYISNEIDSVFIDQVYFKETDNELTSLSLSKQTSSLAYVIYTSGSTGNPKGVMIEHEALGNLAASINQLFSTSENWGWLAAYVFDASLQAVSRLAYGSCLSLFDGQHKLDEEDIVTYLEKNKPDVMDCTPGMVSSWFTLGLGHLLPNLCIGGEAISEELWQDINEWQAAYNRTAINVYGPAECCVNSTWTVIAGEKPHIGISIPNTSAQIMDDYGQIVPNGVIGELYISGKGLARGYLNQAQLTDNAFVKSIDDRGNVIRHYKTGDLVRVRHDGNLEFIGRKDDQVKIRGYRVELGEIKSVLDQLNGIADSFVELNKSNNKLISYCAVVEDSAPAAHRIARLLDEKELNADELFSQSDGMDICGHNISESKNLYNEIFNDGIYTKQGIVINDGDCIFDVGANVGLFSIYLFTQFENLKVFSYEPIYQNFALLDKNFKIYGNSLSSCHQLGLSDKEKDAVFDFYPNTSALSGINKGDEAPREAVRKFILNTQDQAQPLTEGEIENLIDDRLEKHQVNVRLSTLSKQIRALDIESIDLLKIDVERSELDVLKGIEDAHWGKIKQIVAEVHDHNGVLDEIKILLDKHGFEIKVEQEDDLRNTELFNLYATKRQSIKKPRIIHERSWLGRQGLSQLLREQLALRLPEYMVPTDIVLLDKFPLTVNGKLDKALLRSRLVETINADSHEEIELAGDAKVLAGIWQDLLGVEHIGPNDNFFALGGDSILLIQAVSRANNAGIPLKTRQIYSHQTIAEIMPELESRSIVVEPQGAVKDDLTLLPIQKEFFADKSGDINHFNQSVLLVTPKSFNRNILKTILRSILERHDALRLRFNLRGEQWVGEYASLSDSTIENCIAVEALPTGSEGLNNTITERCNFYQKGLNLNVGPLIKAIFFESENEGRLLLVVHHVVVDGVSWRILLSDLENAYKQVINSSTVKLNAKTSSFNQWGEALTKYAQSEKLHAEAEYWYKQLSRKAPLPIEKRSEKQPTHDTSETVNLKLTAKDTSLLLRDCNVAYRTRINELLLAGVYIGMRRWTNDSVLRIKLEGHGREDVFDHLNTTETVGWFTTNYPVELQSDKDCVANVIKSVKEQIRNIPGNGIGYGVLRYLARDQKLNDLARNNEPEFVFNYLGQFDQSVTEESQFQVAPESSGDTLSGDRLREHTLGLNGMVAGGVLGFDLDFSTAQYSRETAEKIAAYIQEGLKAVINHCVTIDKGEFTPSDFPLSTISKELCDEVQRKYEIEKLYSTTPLQRGMLFHSQLDKTAYVTQVYPTLKGPFDVQAFHDAWKQVVARYDIFRTAFVGEGETLQQLVVPHVELPWEEVDWSRCSETELNRVIESYRVKDRAQGFELGSIPLQRVTVAKLAEDRHLMLWTFHHVLLDGWSVPLVYRDVMEIYHAKLNNRKANLQPVFSYENYIKWLSDKGSKHAVEYWKDYLKDIDTPTFIAFDDQVKDEPGYQTVNDMLSKTDMKPLIEFASTHSTTVNCLFQLAWSYLLHCYCGLDKVTFGSTVSGRPADINGIESMIGMFINMVPVKAVFEAGTEIPVLLHRLHDGVKNASEYGHISLVDIQNQSAIKGDKTLFDTMLAFENYPLDAADELENDLVDDKKRLMLESLNSDEQTNYALTVVASLQEQLSITIGFMGEVFSRTFVEKVLSNLIQILRQIPDVEYIEEIQILSDAERSCYCQLSQAHISRLKNTFHESKYVDGVAPRNEIELTMAKLWSDSLNTPINSVHENFFDLGGNSLIAIRLVSAAKKSGLMIEVADLWRYQTIAGICKTLEVTRDDPGASQTEKIDYGSKASLRKLGEGSCRVEILKINASINETHVRIAIQKYLSNEQLNYKAIRSEEGRFLVPANRGRKEFNSIVQIHEGEQIDLEEFIKFHSKMMNDNVIKDEGELVGVRCLLQQDNLVILFAVHESLINAVDFRVMVDDLEMLLMSSVS